MSIHNFIQKKCSDKSVKEQYLINLSFLVSFWICTNKSFSTISMLENHHENKHKYEILSILKTSYDFHNNDIIL